MKIREIFLVFWISVLVSGCGNLFEKREVTAQTEDATTSTVQGANSPQQGAEQIETDTTQDTVIETPAPEYFSGGTGVFTAQPRSPEVITEISGDVTLNFERTDIREATKIVLGDLLNRNYTIDQRVQGVATLQTSRPISTSSLMPTLEMLLRMNGAALIDQGEILHIVPRDVAMREATIPQLGDSQLPLPRGFGVRVVPLQYISAVEMQKILGPLVQQGSLVRVDEFRNLLILTGTSGEVAQMLETIRIFDVDWLQGMSVALFSPSFVDARILAEELQTIFGEGPLEGLIRFTVIERLNAVLVMSPRKTYLDKAAEWIDRLDRDTDIVGRRLFVYKVKNSKALDLAEVLGDIYSGLDEGQQRIPAAEVIPRQAPVEITTSDTEQTVNETGEVMSPRNTRTTPQSTNAEDGIIVSTGGGIRIIADETNNALVVLSTPEQYRQIQSALQQLDAVPLQVLIEATIAEITLTDEFRFGLEWFFTHEIDSSQVQAGLLGLDLDTVAGLAPGLPAFSYTLTDTAGMVRGVLNALAGESKLNVISSPSLMVLNNQTASIQVGDQVPVTTQQQQSTAVGSTIVNSIEFRDTGVLLSVTPRVNPGGLVIMEIEQEVSDVAPGSAALTPTIQRRRINSMVAIESGETVVLGGLIRENQSSLRSGIPFLYQLPIVGHLFGSTNNDGRRTELVVLITPRSVQGANESRRITEEYRNKMESLKPLYEKTGSAGSVP